MFESFHNLDLDDTRSCDEPGAGAPLVPLHRGEPLGRVLRKKVQTSQKHTQREGLYALSIRSRGVGHMCLKQKRTLFAKKNIINSRHTIRVFQFLNTVKVYIAHLGKKLYNKTSSSSNTSLQSAIFSQNKLVARISQHALRWGWGVSGPGGGGAPASGPGGVSQHVNRITDTCKNITLPQLRCGR